MTISLRLRMIALCVLGATSPVALPLAVAHAQGAQTWTPLTHEDAGVSVLLPPNPKVETQVNDLHVSDAKGHTLFASGEASGVMCLLAAVRLNKDAEDLLRIEMPNDPNPLATLYKSGLLLKVQEVLQKKLPLDAFTRKTFTWRGMDGEEWNALTKTVPATGKRGRVRIRVLHSQNQLILLAAGEKQSTADGARRINRFFQSLTLLPNTAAPQTATRKSSP